MTRSLKFNVQSFQFFVKCFFFDLKLHTVRSQKRELIGFYNHFNCQTVEKQQQQQLIFVIKTDPNQIR